VKATTQKLSIISQSLDRAAFVAYFLGAVVPFVALAYLVSVFVLPELSDEFATAGILALVLSIGVLSAAAFLLLRNVARRSIGQMRVSNERLEALLDASVRLAGAPHETQVASVAATCAQRIAEAPAAFFVAAPPGAPPKLEAVAGDRALWPRVEAHLGETLAQALQENRPVLWRGTPSDPTSGAFVPAQGVGAIAVVTPQRGGADGAILRPLATLAAQVSVAARRVELLEAQRNFFVHVTDMLVAALDTHMDLQAGHARRVAQLSNRIGRELGLDDARRQRLHFAALLHDVGMLRIDPGKLDDRRVARQHPQLGHRMLAPIQLWSEVAPLVLHHHEWFDGNGYPEQLAGDAIPLESRIIGVAEAFDSMTSESTYKPSVPRDEAVRRIEAGAGTQFDPAVVRVFLELSRRGDLDLA
jgi:HD-GYP domain-containing protein (c-di-GMP phosphodiesterase class II)